MSIKEKNRVGKFLINILLTVAFFFVLPISQVKAEENFKTVVYFTGIGCPHCAVVSPELHDKVQNSENLILIEYELYQETANASVFYDYANTYDISIGIPTVLYSEDISKIGDKGILNDLDSNIENITSNNILLKDDNVTFEELDLNKLDGTPKLFAKDKALVRSNSSIQTTEEHQTLFKNFLTQDITNVLGEIHGSLYLNNEIEYPGGSVKYDHAIELDGWIMYWNGEAASNINVDCSDVDMTQTQNADCKPDVSIGKVLGLALADSINPCAFSVLLMMLIAITTYHSKDKKQILLSGLSFVLAVFITYIIYGLLIVKAFELLQSIATIKTYLYYGLGGGAILLGLLEIKDYFFYKPGSVGTEMPMFLRPKVQKTIAKITSPIGAFGLGMFVTLFLLPCTVGPYVILGGILSFAGLLGSIPYLLIYNFIFVLPMLIIVVSVYFGTEKIETLNTWKEKNIRLIHLITGVIFCLLGLVMVTGIF